MLLDDPTYLPAIEEVISAFPPHPNPVSDIRFSDYTWNQEWQKFEILTKEYIQELGNYLLNKATQAGSSEEKPLKILEICAGNGRLTHFLREYINQVSPGKLIFIATDSGDAKLKPIFEVENGIKSEDALTKYKPDMAIVSWMPKETDLSQQIRDCESVKEYILIGPANEDCYGKTWETWGIPMTKADRGQVPPHKKDGFLKYQLENLEQYQIGRTNFVKDFGKFSESKTYIFEKNG